MKTWIVAFLLGLSFSANAGSLKIVGTVGTFHVQPGEDVGVEIGANPTLIRLCQPLKPGPDVNYYLYHRLNLAREQGGEVTVIYEKRLGQDPVTGRNKLCLIELVY